MTGQDAVNVAEAFHETLDLDGVILTKLDGDARGGAALSVKEVIGRPDRLRLDRREAGRLRAVPPRPHGRPHPRHGRRAHPDREGRAELRQGRGRQGRRQAAGGRRSPSRTSSSRCSRSRRWGRCPGSSVCCRGSPRSSRTPRSSDKELGRVEAIIHSMTLEERRDPSTHQRLEAPAHRQGQRHHHRRRSTCSSSSSRRCSG